MAISVHTSGEAQIKVATGVSSALEVLGYAVNGVDLEIHKQTFDVMADTGGGEGGSPVDVQVLGRHAVIRAELVVYDEAVLAKIRKDADETTEGLLASAGKLMGAGGYFYRLLILSPVDNLPWNFPNATLVDSYSVRLGSKRNLWNLTWRAIAYIGTGSSKDTILWNRTTA